MGTPHPLPGVSDEPVDDLRYQNSSAGATMQRRFWATGGGRPALSAGRLTRQRRGQAPSAGSPLWSAVLGDFEVRAGLREYGDFTLVPVARYDVSPAETAVLFSRANSLQPSPTLAGPSSKAAASSRKTV